MCKKILIVILVSMTFITGCSSKFAYNNLDWLIYWYVDDYIDLNRQQKAQVDIKLAHWLNWHRKEELQSYKLQLQDIRRQHLQGSLSAEQWLAHFEKGREHWTRFRDRIAPDLTELAQLISDQQVNALFDELEQQNKEKEQDRAERSQQEQFDKRLEDITENFEEYVGRLSESQVNIIKQAMPEFQSTFTAWIAYRRAWQQAARTLLMQRHTNPDFVTSFLHLINNPQEFQDQRFITLVDKNRMLYARLVADIDQRLSAKQRDRMHRELSDLIEDLADLMRD